MNTARSLFLAAAAFFGTFGGPERAEPIHVAVAALPLDHLKTAYLGCDRAANEGALDLASFQRCVVVGDELLKRGFDGDLDRLLAWWRAEKVRFARAETATAPGR